MLDFLRNLALVTLCLLSISCATPVARKAQKAYENGQYSASATLYEKAIKESDKPEYYYNWALALIANKNNQQAFSILEKILETYPKNILLLQAALLCTYEMKEYTKTKEFINRILEINPGDTYARIYQFYLIYEEKKPKTALTGMKNLYKETQDPRILKPISDLCYRTGERKQAIFWLQKSTQAFPNQTSLFLLAKWQIEQKQYLEAAESLSSGLGYGEDALQRFTLARLYLVFIRNKELGLESLKKSIELGYRSQAAFASLLAQRTLIGRAEVRKILPKTSS